MRTIAGFLFLIFASSAMSNDWYAGTNLIYGLGVRYQVIKTFSVRAQWQRYDDVDGFDVNVFGAAALIHF